MGDSHCPCPERAVEVIVHRKGGEAVERHAHHSSSALEHSAVAARDSAPRGDVLDALARVPVAPAHLLGQLLLAVGPKNILWGTDSIWWGSPQFMIDHFKNLQIPTRLQEQFGDPALTDKLKRRILGLNAARLYKVSPRAKRCSPEDTS